MTDSEEDFSGSDEDSEVRDSSYKADQCLKSLSTLG